MIRPEHQFDIRPDLRKAASAKAESTTAESAIRPKQLVRFHHCIMARTDTAGCLNHQHDRRYCCHHSMIFIGCLLSHFDRSWSFIMEAILWRMWRHVITWPLSSLKGIGQRSGRFQNQTKLRNLFVVSLVL
jgi:hypothetical protein